MSEKTNIVRKKWWPEDIKARNGADIECRYVTEMDYDALEARLSNLRKWALDGMLLSEELEAIESGEWWENEA